MSIIGDINNMRGYLDATEFDQFCDVVWRPQIMHEFLIKWLRHHFGHPDRIETPALKDYEWSENISPSSGKKYIIIESATKWDPKTAASNPAIIVRRNQQTNIRMSIGDRLFQLVENNDVQYFGTFWQGSHTVFCIADTGAAAELLATEVYREINAFAWHLLKRLRLHRLNVHSIGETAKLEQAKESFVVPVNIVYVYQQLMKITGDSGILRNIIVDVNSL